MMGQQQKTQTVLFLAECPRLKIGVKLFQQTWEEHIKPFKPLEDQHLSLLETIIKNCDEQQPVWYKVRNPKRLCIVKQVPHFLPHNKFILIALNRYADNMACVTSAYPVDELPAKDRGYQLL